MKGIFEKGLKRKLIILLMLISVIPVLTLGYISYLYGKEIMKTQFQNNLTAIAEAKEDAIILYLKAKMGRVLDFSSDGFIRDTAEKIMQADTKAYKLSEELSRHLTKNKKPLDLEIYETFVINREGTVIASSDKENTGKDRSKDESFIKGKDGLHIKDVYWSETIGNYCFVVSGPLTTRTAHEYLGVIGNVYGIKALNKITTNREGMGKTGEVYIVNKDGYMITESRFLSDVILKQLVDTEPVRLFQSQRKIMTGIYADYRGVLIVGASMGDEIDEEFGLAWTVLSETDVSEAFAPVMKFRDLLFVIVCLMSVIVIIIAIIASEKNVTPIKKIATVATEVASGDLTMSLSMKSDDEIGLLADSFDKMVKNLNEMLRTLKETVVQINSAGNEILTVTKQQTINAREQSAAINETTSAAIELSTNAEQIGKSIGRVKEVASYSLVGMAKIKDSIRKTAAVVSSLSEKSKKIGQITDVIDDVADRTNLLAVNAAIEAARAGEQGRGFTVVADQIQKLADSTAKSTRDITNLVELIQHEMSNVVLSMEQSNHSVEEEVKYAQETADKSKEIAMSTTQQVAGAKQIADAMADINNVMKQISHSSQKSEDAVRQLTHLSSEIGEITKRFIC